MGQLHKRFTDTQARELIQRYLGKGDPRKYIQEILGIRKAILCPGHQVSKNILKVLCQEMR